MCKGSSIYNTIIYTLSHTLFCKKKIEKYEIYEMLSLLFHEEMMVVIIAEKKLHQLLMLVMYMYFFLQNMKLLYQFESIKTDFIV